MRWSRTLRPLTLRHDEARRAGAMLAVDAQIVADATT
jgi:hypothetical protein